MFLFVITNVKYNEQKPGVLSIIFNVVFLRGFETLPSNLEKCDAIHYTTGKYFIQELNPVRRTCNDPALPMS